MDTSPLHFVYCDARGVETEWFLTTWREQGLYVTAVTDKGPRTFLKHRVVRYLQGEGLLDNPCPPPPPRPARRPADTRPQILFTGFPAAQRIALESKADVTGLHVVKTVTMKLQFICGGPTAGPTKMDNAREQNCVVLNEPQFHLLCETGEIPDEHCEVV